MCLENGLGREIIQRSQALRPPQEVGGHLETKVRTASLDPFVSNKIPFIK